MRKLKSFTFLAAMAAGLLALTRCASVQEAELTVSSGPSFDVYASPTDTKTVNDGLSTLWVEGDRFNLFHAKTGTQAYVSDGAFAVDEVETGHARGTLAAPVADASDWFMVYPFTASARDPKAVPVTVGAAAGTAQVQAGADSRAHLAGETFPLAGRISGVAADATPALPVSPLLSVIAVNVTNPGEGTVTVNSIRFQAPDPIVGTFAVDVTGETPVFTAVSASEEALLTVQGGAVLEKGASAVFYLGVKPFIAGMGSTISLAVNDDDVRTMTLTRPVTFSAGKIKTLNITLEPSDPDPSGTYFFKRVNAFAAGRKYLLVAAETNENDDSVQLRMAKAIPEGTSADRLYCDDVEEEDGVITLSSLENAFTFYEGANGTLIRQEDGRYLFNNNSNSNFGVGTEPNIGSWWTVTLDNQGQATILNRTRQMKYNTTSTVRAFQSRKTSESGLLVLLYELQNSDDVVEQFLRNSTPGVYTYEGNDWLYEAGSMQLSVRTGGGETAFRLYEPATYTVVQVTGIPEAIAEGDVLDLRLARYVKQATTHSARMSASVVGLRDGKAWLMAGNGTGFIVCIQ